VVRAGHVDWAAGFRDRVVGPLECQFRRKLGDVARQVLDEVEGAPAGDFEQAGAIFEPGVSAHDPPPAK
jgi:hypothetical protein